MSSPTAPHAREHPAREPLVVPLPGGGVPLTERVCWSALGVAMALSAALILYLNRGTAYFRDELSFLYATPELGAGDLIEPYAGHLIATTRLAYKAILEAFGAGYLPFRVLGVGSVLLCAGLLYALVKRRIGPLPALAPALVMLFFGSAWSHVAVPIGFTVIFSVAAGLAALLALDRGDRRGDVAASALLILSVATYSIGLAFLVGVAISVLIRPHRRRRAWIFLVPLALYSAWWVYSLSAPDSVEGEMELSNVLLFPAYAAESLAMVGAALTGLGYGFEAQATLEVALGWGPAIAALAVAALLLRSRTHAPPPLLWVGLGVVLTYWMMGALVVGELRGPTFVRYVYPGSVGVLLVAAAAASEIRFTRFGLAVLLGLVAASLATNIALLRDGAGYFRDGYSAPLRAQLAVVELAREHVDPHFDPRVVEAGVSLWGTTAEYLTVVDRYGSPALSPAQLEGQREEVRQGADQVLAAALRLGLEPAASDEPGAACLTARPAAPGGEVGFELPPAGAILRARGASPAPLTLGRFADSPSVELGELAPGEPAALRIPPDPSPRPWRATVSAAAGVAVCPPGLAERPGTS